MTTRRQLFTIGALAAAGALLALPTTGRAQDVTLEFVVWNYSLETIQDNVAKFEAAEPRHQGQRHRLHLAGLPRHMVLRLRGNTQTDVIYGGQDWLPSWASAGWLVPLEEHFPEVAEVRGRERRTTRSAT